MPTLHHHLQLPWLERSPVTGSTTGELNNMSQKVKHLEMRARGTYFCLPTPPQCRTSCQTSEFWLAYTQHWYLQSLCLLLCATSARQCHSPEILGLQEEEQCHFWHEHKWDLFFSVCCLFGKKGQKIIFFVLKTFHFGPNCEFTHHSLCGEQQQSNQLSVDLGLLDSVCFAQCG